MRARYYDQGLGRFTQLDTWPGIVDSPVTLNKYLYADVDPLMNIDPSGHFSIGLLTAAKTVSAGLVAQNAYGFGVTLYDFSTGERELTALEAGLAMLEVMTRGAGAKLSRLVRRGKCGGKKNSYTGDTLVHAQTGLKTLDSIEIGDKVLAYNEDQDALTYEEVIHLIQSESLQMIYRIELDNGETIETTAKHPFYVDGEWVEGEALVPKQWLRTTDDEIRIKAISSEEQQVVANNLTVDEAQTYFVSKSGVLSHNAGKKKEKYKPLVLGGAYRKVKESVKTHKKREEKCITCLR